MDEIRQRPEEVPGLLLLFTIDTECSIMRQPNPDPESVVDELIFGDFGDGRRAGGIGLQMDMLERHGFRGCFFLDVLMEYRHGRRAVERTIEAIAERGHEIQLHVHPDHLSASNDPEIAGLLRGAVVRDRDAHQRILELSVDLFEQMVGEQPIAYRAGGFRIADFHFQMLEELGIQVDSSVHPFHNSTVSDWMRARTQPFWVGGVLEAPPSRILLGEDLATWKLRDLVPAPIPAELVSQLPALPDGTPHLLTYVSHSFELLQRRDTEAPEEIAAHVERLLPVLPPDLARRPGWRAPKRVRTFGEETDEVKVDAVEELLCRLADRPDGRCVTYKDLVGLADRFWPADDQRPVDPLPLCRSEQKRAEVVPTRIYSGDLLSRCAKRRPAAVVADPRIGRGRIEDLERCPAERLGGQLEDQFKRRGEEGALSLRLRTLGVAPAARRGALPPLAELLFPAAAVQAVAGECGSGWEDSVPWDVPTFCAWLATCGFELRHTRRIWREADELAAIERFEGRLGSLDPTELRTAALEAEVWRPLAGWAGGKRGAEAPVFEPLSDDEEGAVAVANVVDPVRLPAAAAELYRSTGCGEELTVRIAEPLALASRTTIVLALTRAGFEVIGDDGSRCQLARPIELAELRRIQGLA